MPEHLLAHSSLAIIERGVLLNLAAQIHPQNCPSFSQPRVPSVQKTTGQPRPPCLLGHGAGRSPQVGKWWSQYTAIHISETSDSQSPTCSP